MTFKQNFPERDIERLSAYIDGMLSDAERAELEAQLQTDAALRGELESLRQTVALIKGLHVLKAPRNFELTPEIAKKNAPKIIDMPRAQLRTSGNSPLFVLRAVAAAFVVFFGVLSLLVSQESSIGNILSDVQPALSNSTAQESPVSGEVALLSTFTPTPAELQTDTQMFVPSAENEPSFIPQPLEGTEIVPPGGFGGGGSGVVRPQGGGAGDTIDDFNDMMGTSDLGYQTGIFTEEDLQAMEESETLSNAALVPSSAPEDNDAMTFSMSAANSDQAQTEALIPVGTPTMETLMEVAPGVAQSVTTEPTSAKSFGTDETNVARQSFNEEQTPEVTDAPQTVEQAPENRNRESAEVSTASPLLLMSVVGFVMALTVFIYLMRKR